MNQLISALNWRYATKQFDTTKKLSQSQVDNLVESVRLTPTSYGLQLIKLIIVNDPEIRQQIQVASHGQTQVSTASHLFILAAKTTFTSKDITDHIALMNSVQTLPPEKVVAITKMLESVSARMTPEQFLVWNQKQTYIALGYLLAAAAFDQIDTCPMEGFDIKAVNNILKLDGYTATLICPLGFRSADDTSSTRPKIRQSTSSLLQFSV